jgi:hypothetical protein
MPTSLLAAKTPRRRLFILRILCVVNYAMILAGFFQLAVSISKREVIFRNLLNAPSLIHWFFFLWVANCLLLVSLAVGSILLFRDQASGISLCGATFIFEIVVWLLGTSQLLRVLYANPPDDIYIAQGLGAIEVFGNVGIKPQISLLYPIVGLIVLIALRRGNSQTPATRISPSI